MNLFILNKNNNKMIPIPTSWSVLFQEMKKFLAGMNRVEDRAMLISNSSGLGQIEYRLDEIRMKKFLYAANSGNFVSGSNKRKKKAKISVLQKFMGQQKF